MRAHFKAFDEGVLLVPLDPRYTQVGFNHISVKVRIVSQEDINDDCAHIDCLKFF